MLIQHTAHYAALMTPYQALSMFKFQGNSHNFKQRKFSHIVSSNCKN